MALSTTGVLLTITLLTGSMTLTAQLNSFIKISTYAITKSYL